MVTVEPDESTNQHTMHGCSIKPCSVGCLWQATGNVLKEFLMLLMDRNFNPFAICMLNKQGHIINGNTPVALRFSFTQVSLPQFFSHTKELLII